MVFHFDPHPFVPMVSTGVSEPCWKPWHVGTLLDLILAFWFSKTMVYDFRNLDKIMGKSSINEPFSMAMLNNQRVL